MKSIGSQKAGGGGSTFQLVTLLIGATVAVNCQTDDPCASVVCKPGRVCQAASSSSSYAPTCICAPLKFCRRHRRPKPVCGSDGRRYSSHCELHRAACISGQKLRPQATSACLSYVSYAKNIPPLPPAYESPSGQNTPAAERTTADKSRCDSDEASAAIRRLRFELMKQQCKTSGLTTAGGCEDYSAEGKDAGLIMDRIFAQLDENSDSRITKPELPQNLLKPDCFNAVAKRLLGRFEYGVDRQKLGAALDLPTKSTAWTRLELTVATGSDSASLICPLSRLGPAESIRWRRRGEIESIADQNRSVLSIKNAVQFDSAVYDCCSSLWPSLCASVALSVVAPPYVQVLPAMLVRHQGESARLNCDILRGGGSGGVRWLFNGIEIGETGEIAVQRTVRAHPKPADSGSILSIVKLERRHTGMYTCRAENAAGVAEFAATIYVRLPTETDYSSYPLSPPSGSAAAAAFHAGGCSTINALDCSVRSAVNSDFDDVTLCENLVSCAWGPVASAGRHILYASQPSLGRLLVMRPDRWLAFEPVQLNCPPTRLAYRQQTDQLWIACDGPDGVLGGIFVVESASSLTTTSTKAGGGGHRRRTARRWRFNGDDVKDGDRLKLRRVLRLPDSKAAVLVAVGYTKDSKLVEAVAIDVGDGRVMARVGLPKANAVDTAHLLVQGGTLLLHTSIVNASSTPERPEPAILAIDIRTGARVERHLFSPVSRGETAANRAIAPTGRIFVSEDERHVMHLAGSNVYVYEVLSTGELSLSLHDVAGVGIRSARFQTTPDGGLKILARTERNGAVLVVDLKARVFQLVFDEKLDKKPNLLAPDFGDLALVHSHDSAVLFNTTSLAVTGCMESLFVDLQSVHWLQDN